MYSLAGYGRMITDNIRTDAYTEALKRKFTFEPSGVIELAREIAAANGFADRIEFISKKSTESSLPERVNTIVSDVRGILPFFDQGLVSVIDARDRFLVPGGRMIPQCDTVWIAGVHAPEVYREA